MPSNIQKIPDNIRNILGLLPDKPGIYMYFDKQEKTISVTID